MGFKLLKIKSTDSSYIDGILTDFHHLGYFARKSAAKKAVKVRKLCSFLEKDFSYSCTFIDIPDFNDIVFLIYEKENCPSIHVTLNRGAVDITMKIAEDSTSVPLIYYAYNHSENIKYPENYTSDYKEDYKKYIKYLLEIKDKLDKNEIDDFYKANPVSGIECVY